MTDKRFTLLEDTNGGLDNVLETMVKDNGKFLTHKECCDLLNALHEENEQLRKDVARYRGNFREMEDVKCELAEENEQLRHDATILIQSNQDYRKENERLRKCMNEIYTIERLEEVD